MRFISQVRTCWEMVFFHIRDLWWLMVLPWWLRWLKNLPTAAKSLQSCPTLYHPIDGSPPGSPIPGILQARTLEWVAISFSNAWNWKVKVNLLSCVRLFATPWTAAHQLPCLSPSPATKSLQSCPTLCDPIDGSPPGSPVPEILQARTLEWVAISFSNAWKWKVKVKLLSRVWLFATPWTAAHQAPPSMGFSRQEYWSGVPSPSLKNLPTMR